MFFKKKAITVIRLSDIGSQKGYVERNVSNGNYSVGETIIFTDYDFRRRIAKIESIDHEDAVSKTPKKTVLHCILVESQNKTYK